MKKLYCFADETGQDSQSHAFIVATIVTDKEIPQLRTALEAIESQARTGRRKWHKSRHDRRLNYLALVVARGIGHGKVFFGNFPKPLPYFLPLLETLEQGIRSRARSDNYRTIVTVDGIDKKKASELTGALRLRGLKLDLVRSARDESEPLIRLADMWAGCIRAALLAQDHEAVMRYSAALATGYLQEIKKPL